MQLIAPFRFVPVLLKFLLLNILLIKQIPCVGLELRVALYKMVIPLAGTFSCV